MDLEKNLERVENMLFNICGCSKEESIMVVQEFLRRINWSKEDRLKERVKNDEIYEKWLSETLNK